MNSRMGIPVLMFHSVRPRKMITNNLSVPLETFAPCMKALAESGYKTVTLQQLYDYKSRKLSLPAKSVILTFDDGFLDNWTYAYPVLSHYSLKATVFPSIDFLSDGKKRSLFSYKGLSCLTNANISAEGPLRWQELMEMSENEVFDVQSHTMTHDRYFCSPRIVDFTGAGTQYPWMAWNLYPERKPELLENGEKELPPGIPIWDFGRAIGIRRFFPDKRFESYLVSNLEKRLGPEFYLNGFPLEEIQRLTDKWLEENPALGQKETETEYIQRTRYELVESRLQLEKHLKKPVNILCWPGGARTDTALSMINDCGYIASTAPSSERGINRNKLGENPSEIWRIGTCMRWSYRSRSGETTPAHFISLLDRYRGCALGYVKSMLHKTENILVSGMKPPIEI